MRRQLRSATRRRENRCWGSARVWLLFLGIPLLAGLTYGVLVIRGGFPEQRDRQEELASQERPELALGRTANYDYDPPAPGSYRLPALKPAGDGLVLDTDGKPRRLREILKGHISVLSFISWCPKKSSGFPVVIPE